MSSGKLILLLIAIGMVGLVLLLGYKLDKYEEKGKRKEKITKKRNNEEERNYNEFKSLKNDREDVIGQTNAFRNSTFDFKKEISKSDKYSEEFDKTAVIERVDLSKLENTEESFSYENLYEEPEFENNIDEEFEADMYEDVEEDDAYDYENSNSSTMVFDTTAVNEELGTVKGYDFEEDDVEEEKPKATTKKSTTRKSTTKKAVSKTTKKTTTKKTGTKPKATRKTTAKKVEEKPKTVKKTTAKKTVAKKAEPATKKTKTTTRKTTKTAEKSTKK